MGEFLLYGLDHNGVVRGSERLVDIAQADAARIASDWLETYETVEVWEGPVRVLTLDRRTHAPDGGTP
jgi:hypothetical protein